jgi:hypothetical protein
VRVQTLELQAVPDVTSKLRSDGALIIEPMPSTDHVVRLAECLVQIVAPRVGVSSDLHDGKVYSIMVRNQGRGTTDEYGHVIYSTTNAAFSLQWPTLHPVQRSRDLSLVRRARLRTFRDFDGVAAGDG